MGMGMGGGTNGCMRREGNAVPVWRVACGGGADALGSFFVLFASLSSLASLLPSLFPSLISVSPVFLLLTFLFTILIDARRPPSPSLTQLTKHTSPHLLISDRSNHPDAPWTLSKALSRVRSFSVGSLLWLIDAPLRVFKGFPYLLDSFLSSSLFLSSKVASVAEFVPVTILTPVFLFYSHCRIARLPVISMLALETILGHVVCAWTPVSSRLITEPSPRLSSPLYTRVGVVVRTPSIT